MVGQLFLLEPEFFMNLDGLISLNDSPIADALCIDSPSLIFVVFTFTVLYLCGAAGINETLFRCRSKWSQPALNPKRISQVANTSVEVWQTIPWIKTLLTLAAVLHGRRWKVATFWSISCAKCLALVSPLENPGLGVWEGLVLHFQRQLFKPLIPEDPNIYFNRFCASGWLVPFSVTKKRCPEFSGLVAFWGPNGGVPNPQTNLQDVSSISQTHMLHVVLFVFCFSLPSELFERNANCHAPSYPTRTQKWANLLLEPSLSKKQGLANLDVVLFWNGHCNGTTNRASNIGQYVLWACELESTAPTDSKFRR